MMIAEHLCALALKPLFDAACSATGLDRSTLGRVIDIVTAQLSDPSQRLPNALARSCERAWCALETAIAGPTWAGWLGSFLTGGREQEALGRQIKAFIDQNPIAEPGGPTWNRNDCLREIQEVRRKKLIRATPSNLAQFAAPAFLVRSDDVAIQGLIGELQQAGYRSLVLLLQVRPAVSGPPLLVLATRYFFRREIEQDSVLASSYQASLLEQLSSNQAARFLSLAAAFQQTGEQLTALLDNALKVLEEIADRTRRIEKSTLNIEQEQQRQGKQLADLYHLVAGLKNSLGGAGGELKTREVLATPAESAQDQVIAGLQRFRELPAAQQQQMPALLNELGKLLATTGKFGEAARLFREASGLVTDEGARAETHYNTYRALLERRKTWPEALTALREAAQLDRTRFALFPLDTYEPECVVDVAATGVTFRCRTVDKRPTLIKALGEQELDRPPEAVFQEAVLLQKVRHDGVVKPGARGYVNPAARARPWLELEYVAYPTLEDSLKGKPGLPAHELVPLAVQLADVLAAVHQAGALHLDLRPSNVLVARVDNAWRLKLTGFGMALPRGRSPAASLLTRQHSLTATQVAESLEYAAPEQRGQDDVAPNARADVYGFARLCCFALFKTPQPQLQHWRKLKTRSLAALLDECLSEQPQRRPATMEDVLSRLKKMKPQKPRGQRGQQAATTKRAGRGVRLVVERGTAPGQEFALRPGENVIGRAHEQPVEIDLEKQEAEDRVECSRRHACVTSRGRTLTVEDLGSTNGTLVNGSRVFPKERRRLKANDILQVGTVRLRVLR